MPSEDSSRRLRRVESLRPGIQPVQTGKNVGDSVRAGCGDKPHVQFGRGGLVCLSNQDLAFYLTSSESRPTREARRVGYRGKPSRCLEASFQGGARDAHWPQLKEDSLEKHWRAPCLETRMRRSEEGRGKRAASTVPRLRPILLCPGIDWSQGRSRGHQTAASELSV